MENLRSELVEAQKARTEFIRWKLVLVASIGSVGLGLTGSKLAPRPELVMCCIPFVCVYVDTMCRHLSLRVQVIGNFLRGNDKDGPILAAYETFVHKTREMATQHLSIKVNAFGLQRVLIPLSSTMINLFVLQYGLKTSISLIFWSAVVGLLSTLLVEISYYIRQEAINEFSIIDEARKKGEKLEGGLGI